MAYKGISLGFGLALIVFLFVVQPASAQILCSGGTCTGGVADGFSTSNAECPNNCPAVTVPPYPIAFSACYDEDHADRHFCESFQVQEPFCDCTITIPIETRAPGTNCNDAVSLGWTGSTFYWSEDISNIINNDPVFDSTYCKTGNGCSSTWETGQTSSGGVCWEEDFCGSSTCLGVDKTATLTLDCSALLAPQGQGVSTQSLFNLIPSFGAAGSVLQVRVQDDTALDYVQFDYTPGVLDAATGACCGDGVPDTGECCDDGNNVSGDGCDEFCQCEEYCGDGVQNGNEDCDGADLGVCLVGPCQPDCTCPDPVCGDGVLDAGECCDDGNNVSGDGCSADCGCEANHLQCYKMRDGHKFKAIVDLDSPQFGLADGCKVKGKAKYFCVPAVKTVREINGQAPSLLPVTGGELDRDYFCYMTKCKVQPPAAQIAADQFAERNIGLIKTSMMCVPAIKTTSCEKSGAPQCFGLCDDPNLECLESASAGCICQ